MQLIQIRYVSFLILFAFYQAANANELATADMQWSMPAKNYSANRFSEENQINASNVSQLQVAWTFSTGVLHGHRIAVANWQKVRHEMSGSAHDLA
jgi:glucose dehydrogenase